MTKTPELVSDLNFNLRLSGVNWINSILEENKLKFRNFRCSNHEGDSTEQVLRVEKWATSRILRMREKEKSGDGQPNWNLWWAAEFIIIKHGTPLHQRQRVGRSKFRSFFFINLWKKSLELRVKLSDTTPLFNGLGQLLKFLYSEY